MTVEASSVFIDPRWGFDAFDHKYLPPLHYVEYGETYALTETFKMLAQNLDREDAMLMAIVLMERDREARHRARGMRPVGQ